MKPWDLPRGPQGIGPKHMEKIRYRSGPNILGIRLFNPFFNILIIWIIHFKLNFYSSIEHIPWDSL